VLLTSEAKLSYMYQYLKPRYTIMSLLQTLLMMSEIYADFFPHCYVLLSQISVQIGLFYFERYCKYNAFTCSI